MLLFIYTLVRAPDVGWSNTTTVAGLVAAIVLLAAFVRNERGASNPLVPFSIFRIRGLAPANATQLLSFGGLYAMFFFLSLYMQNVLGYSPINTGLAYLPVTGGFMIAVAVATPLMPRIGTKPVIVTGALVASGGLYVLSHVPVDGAFLADLLPGISAVALGLGCVFTGVTTAATDGVASDKAGVASGLLNASMQFGGALGLAVLSAVATHGRTASSPRAAQARSPSPPGSNAPSSSARVRPCPAAAIAATACQPATRGQELGRSDTHERLRSA